MAMAKKSNRLVPSMVINVEGEGKASADMLCESDVFVGAVFFETIEGIQDAIKNRSKTAVLFQISKSEYYLELDKSQWKQALQTCIDKFIETEDYEKCNDIKILIDKIK